MGKKGVKARVHTYYKVEGNRIIRLKMICPRCGSFMADHADRHACGKCGYTIFKKKP